MKMSSIATTLSRVVKASCQRSITSLTKDKSQRRFLNYEVVVPTKVSPALYVPNHIERPDYANTGVVITKMRNSEIKDREQILRLAEACQVAREVLDKVGSNVEVGMSTDEIDRMTHSFTIERGAYPSPLNYKWYPKSVCTSVNNVVCHGIPDDRKLKDGDIVSIDVSVFFKGYHGDCAETYGVGNVDERGCHLVQTAKDCLYAGIAVCRNGARFSEIGSAIEQHAEQSNCSVIPHFCGHGIGSYFHGPPDIFHFDNESDETMKSGMTFTIEPVIGEGGNDIVILEDGWSAVTADQSRGAQFEHTILITDEGSVILTASEKENQSTN